MNDSLEHRHHAYTTQPEEIAAVIKRITTTPIMHQQKLIGGIDNEVHAVTLRSGVALVVHIQRHGELRFSDITWALERAQGADIPVPEVLLSDHSFIDGSERDVMVQRALRGRSLQDLMPGLNGDELHKCFVQAGAALASLHRIPVDGFGMRRNVTWDFPSWVSVTSRLLPGKPERMTLLGSGLTETDVNRLQQALERLQYRFPCPQAVLLHGDFGPAHLFFDESLTLTGILDFGQFQGGSPIVDFDIILPHILEAAQPAWFSSLQEGYGPTPLWDDFEEHRLLSSLNEHVTYFMYHTSIDDTPTVTRLVPRVQLLLNQLDEYE